MPERRTPSRPTPPRSSPPVRPPLPGSAGSGSAGNAGSAEQQAAAKAKVDLTVNKVLAGAGAAATSAVLGSFFGAMGTVTGAAVGSIASTIVTGLYEHSLNRTKETLNAQIRKRRQSATRGGTASAADTDAISAAETMPMGRIPRSVDRPTPRPR